MLVRSIGKIIKLRRKEFEITQSTLAELAEVSINTIYKLEKGQNNPSLKTLEKILDVLGLEIATKPKPVRL